MPTETEAEPTGASDPSAVQIQAGSDPPRPRRVVRRDGPAMLLIGAGTLAAMLTPFGAGRAGQLAPPGPALAAMAMGTVWLALLCPSLAGGAPTGWSALFRVAAAVDAAGAGALVLAWRSEAITLGGAGKVYLLLATMAMAATAAVRLPSSERNRLRCGLAVSASLVVVLSGPFWAGGAAIALPAEAGKTFAGAALLLNPFHAITAGLVEQTEVAWLQTPVMYHVTAFGDFVPVPPVDWRWTALVYAALGALLALPHGVRRGLAKRGRGVPARHR